MQMWTMFVQSVSEYEKPKAGKAFVILANIAHESRNQI